METALAWCTCPLEQEPFFRYVVMVFFATKSFLLVVGCDMQGTTTVYHDVVLLYLFHVFFFFLRTLCWAHVKFHTIIIRDLCECRLLLLLLCYCRCCRWQPLFLL